MLIPETAIELIQRDSAISCSDVGKGFSKVGDGLVEVIRIRMILAP